MKATASTVVFQTEEEARKIIVGPGEEVRLLVSSDHTSNCCILEVNAAPNSATPLHLHGREDEIFQILDGRFLFSLDGKVVEAASGATIVVPRNTPHCWTSIGPGNGRMLVTFAPGGLDKLFIAIEGIPDRNPEDVAQLAMRYDTVVLGPPLNVDEILAAARHA